MIVFRREYIFCFTQIYVFSATHYKRTLMSMKSVITSAGQLKRLDAIL